MAAPGGFVEPCSSTAVRPRVPVALPARGPFVFPAPYGTQGVRLTNAAQDCAGQDGVNPVGYSYWRTLNAHAAHPYLLALVTLDRQRGGAGPSVYAVDKGTLEVTYHAPLFDASDPLSWATGEGMYWDALDPFRLYFLDDGLHRLVSYDVVTRSATVIFDVRWWRQGAYLWQPHTSSDGRVHSLTVREEATYRLLGSLVVREGDLAPTWFPAVGALDECQVDKGGRYLLIKEHVDAVAGEDNRIIDLATLSERRLLDQEGAAGHSDMGHAYMVAADNWNSLPGALRLWDLAAPTLTGSLVYHSPDWSSEINHVSHCNAQPGPAAGQWVVGSSASSVEAPRNNEIVAVRLDGRLEVCVVAPVLTDLTAPGGGDDYRKLPKATTDGGGEWAMWTSNLGGPCLEALLVQIPTQWLVGGAPPEPPPDEGDGDPDGAPQMVNVELVGRRGAYRKTGGVDGVADAGVLWAGPEGRPVTATTVVRSLTLAALGWSRQAGFAVSAMPVAWLLQPHGYAERREWGVYRGDVSYRPGDHLGISLGVHGASWLKNGTVVGTVPYHEPGSLYVVTTLYTLGGTIGPTTLRPG